MGAERRSGWVGALLADQGRAGQTPGISGHTPWRAPGHGLGEEVRVEWKLRDWAGTQLRAGGRTERPPR